MLKAFTSRRMLIVAGVGIVAAGCTVDDAESPSSQVPSTQASSGPAPSATPATSGSASSGAPTTRSSDAVPAPTGRLEVASGLDTPWSVAWLPNGEALVSQRDDAQVLRIVPQADSYEVSPLGRVPGVEHGGEGGLLGLVAHPTDDGAVFVYRTTAEGNRVDLFTIGDGDWTHRSQIGPIFPRAGNHNGGRLAIGPDGKLYIGTGDAAKPESAQERDNVAGKVLRLNLDGSVPADNPYETPIWSWGHRNVQGLAWTSDGRMWASEFGSDRDDELNFIEKGRNYGWPDVADDLNGGQAAGPVKNWPDTGEASPSGIAVVGDECFVACLRGQRLYRVTLPAKGAEGAAAGNAPTAQVLDIDARLRDVTVTPDGKHLWVVTNEGQSSRIVQVPLDEVMRA